MLSLGNPRPSNIKTNKLKPPPVVKAKVVVPPGGEEGGYPAPSVKLLKTMYRRFTLMFVSLSGVKPGESSGKETGVRDPL